MSPQTLGGYTIEAEVARGGAGVVYRGRAPDGRRVAIKLLLSARAERARRRFAREVDALRRVDHPGLVRVLDDGVHDGVPYLVLDYVEGMTLAERLERRGPLPLREAAELTQQLARALDHAHQVGVLHRDLKPSNVLIDPGGRALLTDFGMTRAVDDRLDQSRLSRTGEFLGSPGYWPPEQAAGARDQVGPHSDIYGLGALLHALLTGLPPHQGASVTELLVAATEPVPPPSRLRPDLDPELEAICRRCLALDPVDRFPRARDLADALGRYLQGAPAPARTTPAWIKAVAAVVVVGVGGALLRLGVRRVEAPTGGRDPAPAVATGDAVDRADDDAPADRADDADDAAAEVAADLDRADALATRGRTLLDARDFAAARQALDEALAVYPKHAAALRDRGQLAFMHEEYLLAVGAWSRYLMVHPEGPDRVILARKLAQAKLMLPRFATTPDQRQALVLHRRIEDTLYDEGPRAALDLTRRSLALYDHPVGWAFAGLLHARLKEHAEAQRAIARAMELGPDLSVVWDRQAAVHAAAGDRRAAHHALTRAIELAPDTAALYHDRGKLAYDLGDTDAALADQGAALAAGAGAQELFIRLERASIYNALGRHVEGLEEARRAAEVAPDEPRAQVVLASSLAGLNRHVAAVAVLSRLTELHPDYATGWANLGKALVTAGHPAQAIPAFERALALEPPGPIRERVLRKLEELRRGNGSR